VGFGAEPCSMLMPVTRQMSVSMAALLWRKLVGVRTPSVAQAGRPPLVTVGLHAPAPAYPVGLVSSPGGPRAWARLACAGRAFFLRCACVHGLIMRLAVPGGHPLKSANPHVERAHQLPARVARLP
jgi:hypothetical protein